MATAIVLFADGFEEIEALAIVDVLRRGSVDTAMVAIGSATVVMGAHDITVAMNAQLSSITDYDMVILPGGLPGSRNLAESTVVHNLLRDAKNNNKFIAAICAAPIALQAAGILDGESITCYPGFETEITDATYTGSRVEVDGKLITGAGPGTAIEFSLELLRQLGEAETASQLESGMLVYTG